MAGKHMLCVPTVTLTLSLSPHSWPQHCGAAPRVAAQQQLWAVQNSPSLGAADPHSPTAGLHLASLAEDTLPSPGDSRELFTPLLR